MSVWLSSQARSRAIRQLSAGRFPKAGTASRPGPAIPLPEQSWERSDISSAIHETYLWQDREHNALMSRYRGASTYQSESIPYAPTTCHQRVNADRLPGQNADDECGASPPRILVRLQERASRKRSENTQPTWESCIRDA